MPEKPKINDKLLKELDQERQQRLIMIDNNERYVKGRNPETLDEAPQKKPDNRITIPFAKMAIETLCGYTKVEEYWENETTIEREADGGISAKEDPYIILRKEISKHNETELETAELYEQALTQGEAYEMFWVSDDLDLDSGMMTPEYKIVPNREIVLIWSRDLKRKLLAYIRYLEYKEGDKKIRTADVYYPEYSERWEMIEGTNSSDTWERDKEGDTEYPYTEVPLAVYPINRDAISVFEAEKDIITGNDKLVNKSVNEVDRFNALITLFPRKISKEIKDKLIDMMAIDNLENFERWPEYLQKDLSGISEFYTMVADRLERLFHKSIKIPDFSDEDFVTAQSGLAMAYKLIGLEFVANKIDQYFYKGLKQREKLITDVIGEGKLPIDDYTHVITSMRNLPVDKAVLVDMVTKLNGILSKETLLRMFPKDIVEDVEAELQRIEAMEPDIDLDNLSIED